AQLDRFLFKIRMDYIPREAEIEVVNNRILGATQKEADLPRVQRGEVVQARGIMEEHVKISPLVSTCLVDIARSIRANPKVMQGISTRSLVLMVPALKAAALMRGRDYVTDDDVKWLAPYVFSHRLSLAPGVVDAHNVVKECSKESIEALSRATLRSS
ncbi:MAG: MoxR family ATPase, partial [Candidatus Eremiobacterota bacterium]